VAVALAKTDPAGQSQVAWPRQREPSPTPPRRHDSQWLHQIGVDPDPSERGA
jgi:hypothetical protein